MNFKFLFIAASFVGMLSLCSSCGGGLFKNELSSIDSLQQIINNIEKEMLSMDTLRIDTISVNASNNINTIKHIFTSDTINMKDAMVINDYKALRKISNRFRQDRFKLWNELYLSRKQLALLSTDLNYSSWDKETGKKYYSFEELATTSFILSFEQHKLDFYNSIKQYDSLNPVIESIIKNSIIQE